MCSKCENFAKGGGKIRNFNKYRSKFYILYLIIYFKDYKIYIQQKNKLFYSLIITIIVFATFFIGFQYFKQKEVLYQAIDEKLKDAAYVGAYILGDELNNLDFNKTAITKEQNIKNANLLSTLTDNSEVKYVYTLNKKNDKVYFSCTSLTLEEKQNNQYSKYLLEYLGATDKLKTAFTNHKTYYGEVTDEYGTFRSIIMPRVTKDGKWYIIGADIEVSNIDEKLNRVLIENIVGFLVFIAILIPFIIKYGNLIKKENEYQLLQQKQLQEQKKLAQMGEMIGNISHQWRQPLSEINSYLMDIEIDFDEKKLDKQTLKNTISKIENLTEHMSLTINDFNNFFRKEKIKDKFNLKEVINQSISICQTTCNKHNIDIQANIIDDIIIDGFKGEFIQVFIAILQNAKDAIVSRKVANPRLTITVKKTDNQVIIDILDNGGGIDEKIIDKIFDPYFTTKFKSQGVGIGLYMTKMILKNNNADISVSNKNNGAEFKIII